MSEPLPISVIVPAYNRERLLERALRSVAAQRPRPPAEIVVVDDCSSDGTGETARRLGARVIRHERNLGEGAARNTALAAATQPWLALLDSDDEWLPNHLDVLWRLRSDHGLVTASSVWCRDGTPESYQGATTRGPALLESPAVLIRLENFIDVSSVLLRRDVVERVGTFDPALAIGADLDMWIRVLEVSTGVISPEVVTIYHVHTGQVTDDRAGARAATEELLRSYADREWWSPPLLERYRGMRAWDDMREELARGSKRSALPPAFFITTRPARLAGVATMLRRRRRLRARLRRILSERPPVTLAPAAGPGDPRSPATDRPAR